MNNEQLPEGYQQTEVGVIPEDWNVDELGDIGKFKNGINKGSEDFGHGSPFVNLMDVFGISSISEIKHLGLVNSNEAEKKIYDLKEGDVLFIRSSVKPSGVGLTTIIDRDLSNTVYSGFLIRFRDNGKLEKDFKKYCFSEDRFRQSVIANSTVSANTNINQDNLKKLILAYPKLSVEQRSIAQALSDVDRLIAALEKAIAKKRAIKTATMQQLLTGKKRLPGFGEGKGDRQTEVGLIPEDWDVKRLGDILKIRHGKSQHEVSTPNGIYPILATGGEIGRTNTPLYEYPSVLIGRKGTIDIPRYMDTPFWTVDTLFYSEISKNTDAKFVFYKFNLIDWYSYNEASGVPSLNAATIENIEQAFPTLKEEQFSIATVLSDMDSAIAALETRLAKTQSIKQGMMQALLTGRVRLKIET